MYRTYEGLPAAASVQQAVCLAQLEILRRLERQRTGVAPARLLPRLFELELRGLVARAGGGRFVRS